METEELKLLRENNQILKQIYSYLIKADNPAQDFLINLVANLLSENMHTNKK
jgi:hypothetical protein